MAYRFVKRPKDLLWQVLLLVIVISFLAWIITNASANLKQQGIASGFDFLKRPSGFGIIQTLIPYSEASPIAKAFAVALLNTLLVSVLGVIAATFLGFAIGLGRLSPNWTVAKLCGLYVETLRNIPLLLQLFVWYFAVLRTLPMPHQSYTLKGIVLNNRGLYLPWLRLDELGWRFDLPTLGRFNYEGGLCIIPELIALGVALATYTAAFIAEIVRSGVLSIDPGQIEAASALGLSRVQTTRLIVVPQALRVMVPPLTSQYLNLTKNSSLAAAIAYPDIVLVFAGTVLLQTGQAVEIVALTMGTFLALSVSISTLMNIYNARLQARGAR